MDDAIYVITIASSSFSDPPPLSVGEEYESTDILAKGKKKKRYVCFLINKVTPLCSDSNTAGDTWSQDVKKTNKKLLFFLSCCLVLILM